MLIAVSPDTLTLEPGSEVVLHQQTWESYENLLTVRGKARSPKIYFDAHNQSIKLLSPLPAHGNRVDSLRDLVKSLLRYQGQDWHCFDPITLKRFQEAGVEPDTCFYIEHCALIVGKERIDLSLDPPPDLAIEVDLTSTTHPDQYFPLQIPELWIYRRGELMIYLWDAQHYQESDRSLISSTFDVKNILPQYLELAWTQGSSVALKQFEDHQL